MGKLNYCSKFVVLIALTILGGCTVSPKPFTAQEFAQEASFNRAEAEKTLQILKRPIDLYQAMALALKYNLSYRVKTAETRLRQAELDLAHFRLLPDAVAQANYTGRNNELASSSFNLTSDAENFSHSTSQDRHQGTGDLTFSWNILDFGLSYVRALQAGDRALIGRELQRKVAQSLMEDVRSAYWRAISQQRLLGRLKRLERRIRSARRDAREISNSGAVSASKSLRLERELVRTTSILKNLQRSIIAAKAELALLMNVAPGTSFKLVVRSRSKRHARVRLNLDQMIDRALRDRVELHENLYQQRINKEEANAALLDLLPGLQAYAGPNLNSNSFLFNNNWVSWGAKASWNLLKIFQYPAKSKIVETQDEVLRAQSLALTVTIMAQVHISRINYSQRRQELIVARDLRSVQNRLLRQMRTEASADLVSKSTVLREEMNSLISEAKYDIANASSRSAYAKLYSTMGWDPLNDLDTSSLSVNELAKVLKSAWANPDRRSGGIMVKRALSKAHKAVLKKPVFKNRLQRD